MFKFEEIWVFHDKIQSLFTDVVLFNIIQYPKM